MVDDHHQQEWFDRLPRISREFLDLHQRPLVTVSYAQSVDGSIASRNREQLRLSGQQSMVLTHRIRAACDAIVVGINTVLIDDPQLTVRLTQGRNPQPIVLDSKLRIPMLSRLLGRTDCNCWLACTDKSTPVRTSAPGRTAPEIIRCSEDPLGRVDLSNLLQQLGDRGIRSIMVEGGSQVITSFIEARLVDQMIITIAPCLVGGLQVLNEPITGDGSKMHLNSVSYQSCGSDIIIWGKPQWQMAKQ